MQSFVYHYISYQADTFSAISVERLSNVQLELLYIHSRGFPDNYPPAIRTLSWMRGQYGNIIRIARSVMSGHILLSFLHFQRIYLSLAYSRKTHLKCHFISFSVCIILINVFLREAHQARKIVLFFAAKEGIARLKRQFSITIKIEHLCQWEDLIILCGIRINCQMGLSNKTVSFYIFILFLSFCLP